MRHFIQDSLDGSLVADDEGGVAASSDGGLDTLHWIGFGAGNVRKETQLRCFM